VNEDTLGRALGALRTTRMSEAASDRVREELESAWRDRASRQTRRRGFVVPGFARAFAIAALVFAVGFGTLRAGADSPLYGARITLEDGLVGLQADPVGYLGELYQERLEEAARFEATGNALAAGRARDAQEDALRLLNKIEPQVQQEPPQPSPSTATRDAAARDAAPGRGDETAHAESDGCADADAVPGPRYGDRDIRRQHAGERRVRLDRGRQLMRRDDDEWQVRPLVPREEVRHDHPVREEGRPAQRTDTPRESHSHRHRSDALARERHPALGADRGMTPGG